MLAKKMRAKIGGWRCCLFSKNGMNLNGNIIDYITPMGNASLYLEKYDMVRFFRKQDWVKLSVNQNFQIWRHKFTHQTAEVYHLHEVPTIEDMKIFDFRNKHQQLVKIYFLAFENQTGICGNNTFVQILVEHIPYRLEKLSNLTQQEALTIFVTALRGFKVIEEQFGPVEPSQQLIGVNSQGKAKVWLNRNPTLNYTENRQNNTFSSKFAQVSIRIRKLYAIVEQKCQDTFLPFSVKEKFCNRNIAYEDAITMVQEYAKSYKISLSQYLSPEFISQKLASRKTHTRNKNSYDELSKGSGFQKSFLNHNKEYVTQKTLKKALSLININRAPSILNKNQSEGRLNYSRIVFKSPHNSSVKVSARPHSVLEKSFTKISFVQNNTPTKVFYSPKSSGKTHVFPDNVGQIKPFPQSRELIKENSQQTLFQNSEKVLKSLQEQCGPSRSLQVDKIKYKLEHVLIQSIQMKNSPQILDLIQPSQQPFSFQNSQDLNQQEPIPKECFSTFGHEKQQQFLKTRKQEYNIVIRRQPSNKKQSKDQPEQVGTQKQVQPVVGSQSFSIIDKFYQQSEKRISINHILPENSKRVQSRFNDQNLLKIDYQEYKCDSNGDGINSPCFKSSVFESKHVSFAEITQEKPSQLSKNIERVASENALTPKQHKIESLQSIDSLGQDKRRKRTSIFGTLQFNFNDIVQQHQKNDAVREMDESSQKQPVFGSFSKIGSFNIVRVDSLLQKKYEDMINKQDRENRLKIQLREEKLLESIKKQPHDQNAQEQDFLNVNYLEKNLDKKYSPDISKRTVEKQHVQEDDTLNIQKLQEGLLKFSKHKGKQEDSVKQEDNESQEVIVQKINFLQVSPALKNPANVSMRYADSDSCRVDTKWEVSDTSINVAILNNKEKEREQSLKKTNSSSHFQFYDSYGRKNSNYYETNKFYDSKFSKEPKYSNTWGQTKYYTNWDQKKNYNTWDQKKNYNTWEQKKYYNTWESSTRQPVFQQTKDKFRKDYQFEQKYKKHVKLRTDYSRPTSSYQSNYQQLPTKYKPRQESFKYQTGKPSIQTREMSKKRHEQVREIKETPSRKLTYDQLRQLLWN